MHIYVCTYVQDGMCAYGCIFACVYWYVHVIIDSCVCMLSGTSWAEVTEMEGSLTGFYENWNTELEPEREWISVGS